MVKKKVDSEGESSIVIPDNGYVAPTLTPERAGMYSQNIHIATQIENLQVQIFPGMPDIWVEDTDGEHDEDLTTWMRTTAERVNLYPAMQIAWIETMVFGASVKSPGYNMLDGRVDMIELRNLPAISFRQYPGYGDIVNELMPGIIIKDGETEVWQTLNDLQQKQIQNFDIITDPTAPQPAGIAYLLPCYPVAAAINHANKASDQQVNRVGSPVVFPQSSVPITGNIKTWMETFAKKWGRNTAFVIPPEISFPDVKILESKSAKERLEMLIKWIEWYFNPTTVLSKSGNSIGASDKGAAQIWANFIGGTQAWIEEEFEKFFRYLLDANGYEDRYVRIQLKRPDIDRSAERREQIKVGIEAKSITPEEVRRNLSELDLDETTPEVLLELKEQYKAVASAGIFGNVAETPKETAIVNKTEARLEEINKRTEEAILKLAGAI